MYKQIGKNSLKSSKLAKGCFLIYMQYGRTLSLLLFNKN